MINKLAIGVAVMLTLQACSSRPREFTPVLAAASPGDQAQFDADFAACAQLLADGKLNSSGRLASGAAGAAAGATTAVLGGAAASSAGLYGGGMAIASATIVALPLVAIAGAWGMAKAKRGRKERAIQVAMAGCLAERGHDVTAWRKKGKLDAVDKPALTPKP